MDTEMYNYDTNIFYLANPLNNNNLPYFDISQLLEEYPDSCLYANPITPLNNELSLEQHNYIDKPKNTRKPKQPVPEHLKDSKYWKYRTKNNLAAKKSRAKKKNKLPLAIPKQKTPKKTIPQQIKALKTRIKEIDQSNIQLRNEIIKLTALKQNLLINHLSIYRHFQST